VEEEAKAEEVKVEEEAKVEEVKAEAKVEEVKAEANAEVKVEPVLEEVKAEAKAEAKAEEATVPQIVIDTTRHVGFSDYKSVFDSSDPDHSDIVLDQVSEEEDYNLDILDGPSEPLDLDDTEQLGAKPPASEQMTDTDYDVLV
jgi:glutaredoxin